MTDIAWEGEILHVAVILRVATLEEQAYEVDPASTISKLRVMPLILNDFCVFWSVYIISAPFKK